METLISFLASLNSMSPLGVIALLVLIVFYLVKNGRKMSENHDTLVTIKGNDLHELPQMAQDMRTAVETLQRIEVRMGEEFSYIRARLNGGPKV